MTLVAVTQPSPFIAGPLLDHRNEWTERTDGRVAEVPYEDLYQKTMTSFNTEVHAYDIIEMGATWLSISLPISLRLRPVVNGTVLTKMQALRIRPV